MNVDLKADVRWFRPVRLLAQLRRSQDGHLELGNLLFRRNYVVLTFDRLRYLNEDLSRASWEASPETLMEMLIQLYSFPRGAAASNLVGMHNPVVEQGGAGGVVEVVTVLLRRTTAEGDRCIS
jgi:hypothetical protein